MPHRMPLNNNQMCHKPTTENQLYKSHPFAPSTINWKSITKWSLDFHLSLIHGTGSRVCKSNTRKATSNSKKPSLLPSPHPTSLSAFSWMATFLSSIANYNKRRISLNLQEGLKPFRCHLEHLHSRLPGRRWVNRCFSQNRDYFFFFLVADASLVPMFFAISHCFLLRKASYSPHCLPIPQ